MRQFDVVTNPDPSDAGLRPFLIVLQSDLVSGLNSTVVAPLVPERAMKGARQLNPILTIDDQPHWLAAHELFAMDRRLLGKPIANLASERDVVIAALDMLFTGI
jgi:toxin CcdB